MKPPEEFTVCNGAQAVEKRERYLYDEVFIYAAMQPAGKAHAAAQSELWRQGRNELWKGPLLERAPPEIETN